MKIKEKFANLELDEPYIFMCESDAEKCEKIADDYAIEFTEWICKHHETDAIVFGILDTKELLKKFKSKKGL